MSMADGFGYSHQKDAIVVSMIQGHATAPTLTGVALTDKIISVQQMVIAHDGTYGFTVTSNLDITSLITITAANTLACSSTTADTTLIVVWLKVHPQT